MGTSNSRTADWDVRAVEGTVRPPREMKESSKSDSLIHGKRVNASWKQGRVLEVLGFLPCSNELLRFS